MEQLRHITAGETGGVVATNMNWNMDIIQGAIGNIEEEIREISGGTTPPGPEPLPESAVTSVVITASPEVTVMDTSSNMQRTSIPITVYAGNTRLDYTGVDDGETSFAVDLGDPNVRRDGVIVATIIANKGGTSEEQTLTLVASINPNVVGSFNYTFKVVFRGFKFIKTISFNMNPRQGESAMSVELAPSSIILTQNVTDFTIPLTTAFTNYKAYLGNDDVTSDVSVECVGSNCIGEVDEDASTARIKRITSNYEPGIETFTWTDINGNQHSERKPVYGFLTLTFTYTSQDGFVYTAEKKFSFAVNYMGTFKETITGDIHRQVSNKVETDLNAKGELLTTDKMTEIMQSAQMVAISAATESASGAVESYFILTSDMVNTAVNNFSGYVTTVIQTASGLTEVAKDVSGNTAYIDLVASGLTQATKDISGNTAAINLVASGLTEVVNDVSGNTAAIQVNSDSITQLVQDVSGNTSRIEQTADSIRLVVSGMQETGIDIQTGMITLNAENTNINGNLNIYHSNEGLQIFDDYNMPQVSILNRSIGDDPSATTDYMQVSNGDVLVLGPNPSRAYTVNDIDVEIGSFVNNTQVTMSDFYVRMTYLGSDDGMGWYSINPGDSTFGCEWEANHRYVIDPGDEDGATSRLPLEAFNTSFTSPGGIAYVTFSVHGTLSQDLVRDYRYIRLYCRIYGNVAYSNTSGVIVGLDGVAVMDASGGDYSWIKSNNVLFKTTDPDSGDANVVRFKDGKLERCLVNTADSPGVFGDISSTIPVKAWNGQEYEATNNDGLILMSSYLAPSGEKRKVKLPDPQDAAIGKIIYIKRTFDEHEVEVYTEAGSQIISSSATEPVAKVDLGVKPSMFINDGFDWIQFTCG